MSMDVKNIVNEYINKKLLRVDDLSGELNGTMVDRLFAKKFRKYAIAPEVRDSVSTKLSNILAKK